MASSRHPLVVGTRWLLPAAVALAVAGAVVAHQPAARIIAGFFALIGVAAWLWQERHRPTLLLDDEGYAIEQLGAEKLRVRWTEVRAARIDRRETAIYLDCGDKARNLFVPPSRGYGFRFADAAAVLARVLASVPADRVVEVERIDAA
jgi:hypothetical protein